MTGSAFLKRLSIGLDFLPEEQRETVLQYYRDKLSFADTISEEEEIVKHFGTPDAICKKLREAVESREEAEIAPEQDDAPEEAPMQEEDLTALPKAEADPTRTVQEDEDLTEIPAPERTDGKEISDTPEDVIFSKPPAEEEGHELVQSMDDHESFNLYGKKVDVKKDPDKIELPAEVDDLTPEELELAKQSALEKAKRFDEEVLGEETPDEQSDASSDPESEGSAAETGEERSDGSEKETDSDIGDKAETEREDAIPEVIDPDPPAKEEKHTDGETEENAAFFPDEDEEELVVTREYPGIFRKLFPGLSDSGILILKILFSVIFSPLLLLVFGTGIALYAGLTVAIALIALVLFLLMVAFIIGGVVELIYGVTQLFYAVSVGLIEIGLGTVLFGIVTAVVGLIYEFLFGVVPKTLKGLTRLCKKYLRLLAAVIYGGRA